MGPLRVSAVRDGAGGMGGLGLLTLPEAALLPGRQ